jgi:hypothetical protein
MGQVRAFWSNRALNAADFGISESCLQTEAAWLVASRTRLEWFTPLEVARRRYYGDQSALQGPQQQAICCGPSTQLHQMHATRPPAIDDEPAEHGTMPADPWPETRRVGKVRLLYDVALEALMPVLVFAAPGERRCCQRTGRPSRRAGHRSR